MEFKDNELASLESDLPALCLQLMLFINAGMICSNSFREIVRINKDRKRPIDVLLRYVDHEADLMNIPFENAMYIAASKIKSGVFLRFAILVFDNSSKGTDMVSKLESEIDLLENSRLSLAKSKAKKAETLLCFPLMLLLISLILICISPAFMQI